MLLLFLASYLSPVLLSHLYRTRPFISFYYFLRFFFPDYFPLEYTIVKNVPYLPPRPLWQSACQCAMSPSRPYHLGKMIPNHSIWISDVREDNNFSTYTTCLVTSTHDLANLFFRPFLPYPTKVHVQYR